MRIEATMESIQQNDAKNIKIKPKRVFVFFLLHSIRGFVSWLLSQATPSTLVT
jgi:hypothetical protein